MFAILNLLRKFIKIITSQSALWQVFLGAFLGVVIGMLPWFRLSTGINPLPVGLLLVAVFINCHLSSVLLFTGIGAGLAFLLDPLARSMAGSLDPLARSMADVPFAYMCLLSDTKVLALTILALVIGLIAGIVMAWAARAFERHLRERLMQRKKLLKAGKVAGNGILLRTACWFLGI